MEKAKTPRLQNLKKCDIKFYILCQVSDKQKSTKFRFCLLKLIWVHQMLAPKKKVSHSVQYFLEICSGELKVLAVYGLHLNFYILTVFVCYLALSNIKLI